MSADHPFGGANRPDPEPDTEPLDALEADLREAAARLRAGDLSDEEAAALVERCADLAARAGAELDRRARAAAADPVPGQETLL